MKDKLRMCKDGALRDPSYDKPTPFWEDLFGFIIMVSVGVFIVFISHLFDKS